jgi:uncharacterized membrane protein
MQGPVDPVSFEVLKESWDRLTERERQVIERASRRLSVPRDAEQAYAETTTFGDRLADRVASVGGSWSFVVAFGLFLLVWASLNRWLPAGQRFDPYPFIFLNLLLSMLAAVQAPIIMMSQNRQAAKDRVAARLDYEVNLKAELEIAALHAKIDRLAARTGGAGEG